MPKLLIVDDEKDTCAFAGNFFRKRNIQVFTANGGQRALEIIRKEHPDLILLDVRMEEMSGIDVLRKLRKPNGNTKVIMVTGDEDINTVNEAQKLGVNGYIHKPLILDELEKEVLKELEI